MMMSCVDQRSAQISYRGKKYLTPLSCDHATPTSSLTILDLKNCLSKSIEDETHSHGHIKFIYAGKTLQSSHTLLETFPFSIVKPIKIIAMGMSVNEIESYNNAEVEKSTQFRVRDDLTSGGKIAYARKMKSSTINVPASSHSVSTNYKFHNIEVLPMLSSSQTARDILTTLSKDVGILACMDKHKFTVGTLMEMYPEGSVGESPVCVMGLNVNKGMQIKLRLRTDDLKGFRKINSIRKVLFHELAHNVHSDHDSKFFELMRVIENDCNSMNWETNANTRGKTSGGGSRGGFDESLTQDEMNEVNRRFEGGVNTLGGSSSDGGRNRAGDAALMRSLTVEDEEVAYNCGCEPGRMNHITEVNSMSVTTESDLNNIDVAKKTQTQIAEKRRAEANGLFAKNQKCLYLDPLNPTPSLNEGWVECKILDVHMDNGYGVDEVYYSIAFLRGEERVEKQTVGGKLK